MPHPTPGDQARAADRAARGLTALLVLALAVSLAAVVALRPDPHRPDRRPAASGPPTTAWRPQPGVYRPRRQTVRCTGHDAAAHETTYRDALRRLHVRVRVSDTGRLSFQAVRDDEALTPFEPRAAVAPNGVPILVLSGAATPDGRAQVRWEPAGTGGVKETRTFESATGDRFACSARFVRQP